MQKKNIFDLEKFSRFIKYNKYFVVVFDKQATKHS